LRAAPGSTEYGILENRHLGVNATTCRYECRIRVDDESWSYEQDSVVRLVALNGDELHHTDRNTLRRTAAS